MRDLPVDRKGFVHVDADIRDREGRSHSSPSSVRTRSTRRGAAVARPGGARAVRGLRHQRRGHIEPAGGHAPRGTRSGVRVHEHEQGVRRRAQRHSPGRAVHPLGVRRSSVPGRHRRNILDRCQPPQPLRCLQGRSGRDVPGVRALLRSQNWRVSRRPPHGHKPRGQRASRLPGLLLQVRDGYSRVQSSDTREKQVRDQILMATTWCAHSKAFIENPTARCRVQPRRRERPTACPFSSRSIVWSSYWGENFRASILRGEPVSATTSSTTRICESS